MGIKDIFNIVQFIEDVQLLMLKVLQFHDVLIVPIFKLYRGLLYTLKGSILLMKLHFVLLESIGTFVKILLILNQLILPLSWHSFESLITEFTVPFSQYWILMRRLSIWHYSSLSYFRSCLGLVSCYTLCSWCFLLSKYIIFLSIRLSRRLTKQTWFSLLFWLYLSNITL